MKKRSPITTHILDTSHGKPAAGVSVSLERREKGQWQRIGASTTNNDGRIEDLLQAGDSIEAGMYRLNFETEPYFKNMGVKSFFPLVTLNFEVQKTDEHYHVPLLLSPFGYSTYRGS